MTYDARISENGTFTGDLILSLAILILSASVPALAMNNALGQSYPSKPIRFVVPGAPGSSSDIVARTIGSKLNEAWGQPVVADNRTGAGGIIGTDIVAKAVPDGYVIVIVVTSFAINASLYPKLPYDPVKDFSPVVLLGSTQNVLLIHPSLSANSVRELIAIAKSKPGQFNYGSPGRGTGVHLATELFKQMAGIDVVHIPYKGAVLATSDLIGGRLFMVLNNITTALPLVKAGKLRALAVTGSKRSPLIPNLPTIDEAALPGYVYKGWFGVLAPAGIPKEVSAKLNAGMVRIMKMPDVEQKLSGLGFEPATSTPGQFAEYVKEQITTWAKVIKESNLNTE